MKRVLFLVSAFFLLCGFGTCAKKSSWRDNDFVKHPARLGADRVDLPESLWEKIEGLYLSPPGEDGAPAGGEAKGEKKAGAAESKEKPAEASSEKKSETTPTEFVPLKVYLVERNTGILHGANQEIDYGPGGGELDLAEFVEALNGSFYLAVEFLPEAEDIQKHVYFLSNGVTRKNSKETIGAGCHAYYDVSTAFARAMEGDGFLLNTSEQRDVSALAGTYFFAAVKDKKLQLASLTIRDSAHKPLQCRGVSRESD